jgi:hypothetical protein
MTVRHVTSFIRLRHIGRRTRARRETFFSYTAMPVRSRAHLNELYGYIQQRTMPRYATDIRR